eukprot:6200718-Pleurochrysis_carterae.AAC.3
MSSFRRRGEAKWGRIHEMLTRVGRNSVSGQFCCQGKAAAKLLSAALLFRPETRLARTLTIFC